MKDARFCTAVVGVDPDMQNDLALTFDTMLWRVAVDLGFEEAVEDRSQTPALTYLIGNGCRSEPMDCNRKLWKNAQTYDRARLARRRATRVFQKKMPTATWITFGNC